MSKCASCDQHNAFTYCPDADDMYCAECYEQKLITMSAIVMMTVALFATYMWSR